MPYSQRSAPQRIAIFTLDNPASWTIDDFAALVERWRSEIPAHLRGTARIEFDAHSGGDKLTIEITSD